MTVELWTDGSGGNIGEPGGWAYILRARRGDEWVERPNCGPASATSCQRMEIMALIMGLRALKRPCTIDFYADSQYVVFALTKGWLASWKAKRWPRKVKNPDLWMIVDELLVGHTVRGHWTRGHVGTPLNERCDELAGSMRAAAIAAESFMPEPAGDASAVQPALLDAESEAHLDAIAATA